MSIVKLQFKTVIQYYQVRRLKEGMILFYTP